MSFLARLLINAAALWVATRFVPGVTYTGSWLPFLGVAFVFGVVNAIIRPVAKILTFPLPPPDGWEKRRSSSMNAGKRIGSE